MPTLMWSSSRGATPAMPANQRAAYTPQPASSGIAVFLRALYTITMYLLTPVILYRLTARGIRHREYFSRWRERYR